MPTRRSRRKAGIHAWLLGSEMHRVRRRLRLWLVSARSQESGRTNYSLQSFVVLWFRRDCCCKTGAQGPQLACVAVVASVLLETSLFRTCPGRRMKKMIIGLCCVIGVLLTGFLGSRGLGRPPNPAPLRKKSCCGASKPGGGFWVARLVVAGGTG